MFEMMAYLIIITVFFIIMMVWTAARNDDVAPAFWGFLVVVFIITDIITIIGIIGSKNSAQFYNTIYKTNYTAEDVFWNESFIKNYLVGEKKNFNVDINKEIK